MKNPAAENAFTLVELLVSSGILAIVMMVLLTSMSTGLSLWRNTEQKVSVDRDGRTAMQLLAEDLAGIVNLNNPSLRPQFDTSSNAVTPLRFLTLKPLDYQTNPASDIGDVCYVEYRFENNALKRAMVTSAATFAALTGTNFPQVNTGDFEMLATNLLSFKVYAWDSSGQPAAGSAARAVDYRMEVVDSKGLDNFRLNNNATNSLLIGQQFFSGRASVPAPR